ncbi:MAG: hypothetical protein ACR2MK_04745 [Solirubrobacteraceae bacterium]
MGPFATRLLAALAVSAILAACGGSSSNSSPDAAHVKQTITRAFHALATGDGATLCSLATADGQRALAAAAPHSTCAKVVALVGAHLTPSQKAALESVQVSKVTIDGDHATVKSSDLTVAHGSLKGFIDSGSAPTRLAKQSDGSWKISR